MVKIELTDDGNVKQDVNGTVNDILVQVLLLPVIALDILVKKMDVPAASAGNILIEAIQMRLRDLSEEKK